MIAWSISGRDGTKRERADLPLSEPCWFPCWCTHSTRRRTADRRLRKAVCGKVARTAESSEVQQEPRSRGNQRRSALFASSDVLRVPLAIQFGLGRNSPRSLRRNGARALGGQPLSRDHSSRIADGVSETTVECSCGSAANAIGHVIDVERPENESCTGYFCCSEPIKSTRLTMRRFTAASPSS